MRLIKDTKPMLVIGSPECTPFSMLQGLNEGKYLDPAEKRRELERAKRQLKFCTDIY